MSPQRIGPARPGLIRRIFVVLALIFITAYTGVFFKLNDRFLGSLISSLVTHSVRGTFELGRAHYDYFGGLWSILTNAPTHVVGGDFEMRDPDGNLVMKVPHVEADAHLRELIGSLVKFALHRHFHLVLHFSKASIPGGYCVVAPTRSTFGTLKPEINIVAAMSGKKPSIDDKSNLVIEVDDIDLGPVEFALASSNASGQLSWVGNLFGARGKGRLSYSSSKRRATPDGPAFFFDLSNIDVDSGQLLLGDFRFPLSGLHVDHFGSVANGQPVTATWGARQKLDFVATGVTHEGEVQVTGALTDVYSSHPGVRLRLALEHGAGLAKLLPDPVASWIGGDPHGVLTIEGPFSNVQIGGELEGAEVDVVGLHVTSAGGRMRLLENGLLRLEALHGELAHGKLRGKLDLLLSQHGSWRLALDASGVDPAGLPPIPPSLRPILAGRFAGKVELGGSLDKSERADLIHVTVAEGTLDRSAVDRLPRHLELAGSIESLGSAFTLRKVELRGEGLALLADGKLDVGKNAHAQLAFALSATPGDGLSRMGLPSDLQVARAMLKGTVAGPLLGLEGEASVEIAGAVVRGRRIDHATARVGLRGGRLHIDDLVGQGVGAALTAQGEMRLFDVDNTGRTRLDKPLSPEIATTLSARGASLSEVFATVGVVGNADLDVSLNGPLSAPRGRASMVVPQLSLLGDRYKDGRVAFDFTESDVKVAALHLQRVDGGVLDGKGDITRAGGLDVDLSPRDFPLVAIPGVASLPVAILGTISGQVHVGGDVTRPQPGGVISLVGAKIRDTLFGDGSLKLEPGADAIHITGRFFQSYSIDGYLTLLPKISIAVTVKFEDIELERLFPEMRRLAEVRGRATGEARLTADAEAGLTFAELRLDQLSLILSGLDETGQARRLVVRNEEAVTLSTNGHDLSINRCALRSALGAFSITGRIAAKDTAVALEGKIGLELLEYFFSSFFQHMSGDALVNLAIKGDLSERPTVLGTIDLRRANLQPRGLEGHRLFVPSGIVSFEPDGVQLRDLKVEMDGAVARASGRIGLAGYVPGGITGEISGELSAKLLQWAAPNQIDEATGRVAVQVGLSGSWQRPEWRGQATIKNLRLSLRRSAREIVVSEGTLKFVNYDIAIGCGDSGDRVGCKSITGLVDEESRFAIDGKVGFGDRLSLRALSLRLDASDLSYSASDFALRVSPSVELTGDSRHLQIAGVVNVVEGRYTANFDIADLLFKARRTSERAEPFWEGVPLLEQMKLDLRARTTGPFLVRNNIADLTFGADLQIGGTLTAPAIGGAATVDQGGTIRIPVCGFPFQTERSQLTFDPEKRYPDTPMLHIAATGVLVSDRSDTSSNINIQVVGPLSAPQLIASTQQGLSGSDILTMCVSRRTADEIRRGVSPGTTGGTGRAPAMGAVQGTTTSEGVAKGASGAIVASAIDPLRKVAHLDTLSLEFGATGVDIQACKRWTRGLKTCGQGEFGFISGTRVGGFAEYRISDQLSVLGRGEYLTRGTETVQDSLTRGRLELNLKLPLVW